MESEEKKEELKIVSSVPNTEFILEKEQRERIHRNILIDKLNNPANAKPIGRDGLPIQKPLLDEKLSAQMYWHDENQTVGLILAASAFMYLILIIGFSPKTFDLMWQLISGILGFIFSWVPRLG